ncbi:MAG: ZIP family metal transporter [Comamonas sp.]|nr:ZIP family metal transporter [Comamonas sp.]
MPKDSATERPTSRHLNGNGTKHSIRLWVGFVISVLGVCALFSQFWTYAQQQPVVLQALGGGMVAALTTALGTVPVMFSQRMSERTQDTLFGFGAGVMLAACVFSLILPGMAAVREQAMWGNSEFAAAGVIGLSVLLGAAAMMGIDRLLPHEHFIKGREGPDLDTARKLQRTWLFVFAITLHNFPEGLAIGVGYASNGIGGNALATGIAIQDIPEGLVVAVALLAAGYRRSTAVLLAMLTGLVEPIGAVLGAAVVSTSIGVLPWGLGFAAGAMLFVISHEIIPESHRKGHESFATGGLMLGFVLMMFMDTALG